MHFPFALEIPDTTAGARRQGSSTSALTRGLDCGHRQPKDDLDQSEGKNQGNGIGNDASITGIEKTQSF